MIFTAVLILLLAVAPAVEAACAWVLWSDFFMKVGDVSHQGGWTLLDTLDSRHDCMARLDERVQRATALKVSEAGESYRVLIPVEPKDRVISFTRIECLPDTIDPRGPKGGGR
jgi:hypothetical protein